VHSCLRKQCISYAVFCLKKKTLSLHGPPFHESTNIEQHRSPANIRVDPSCYFEHRKNTSDPADLRRKTHTVTRYAIFLTPNTSDTINTHHACGETTSPIDNTGAQRLHAATRRTYAASRPWPAFLTSSSKPLQSPQNCINNQERVPEVSSTRRLQYLS